MSNNIKYPITIIGRRASGKTTLLSVLKGISGFKSEATNIAYSFNTNDENTRSHLGKIYDRLLEQENTNPSDKDKLSELSLYVEANGHRIDFNVPDIAGEYFEKEGKTIEAKVSRLIADKQIENKQIELKKEEEKKQEDNEKAENKSGVVPQNNLFGNFLEKKPDFVTEATTESNVSYSLTATNNTETFKLFNKFLNQSNALIILIAYNELFSDDIKYFTEAITKSLNTLKAEQSRKLPFVTLAITKFDLNPDYKKNDYEHNKKLLNQLIEGKDELKTIKNIIEAASGEDNSMIAPVSAFGSYDTNVEGKKCPPKHIEPQGVVEMFENTFKGMIKQSAINELALADNDPTSALTNLNTLKDLSPFEDLNEEIQKDILEVNKKIKNRDKKYIKICSYLLIFVLSVFAFYLIKGNQIRNSYIASGKVLLKDDVKDTKQVIEWYKNVEKYSKSDKEMSELITQMKIKYDSKIAEEEIAKIEIELNKIADYTEKTNKIAEFIDKYSQFQLVQNWLIKKNSEIVADYNKGLVKEELEKLQNLPLEKRVSEAYEKIEKTPLLSAPFREMISKDDDYYYTSNMKPYVDKMKSKSLESHSFYYNYRLICNQYLNIFKTGKYRDACLNYIKWTNEFERNGITLKKVTMKASLPGVSGYDELWNINTPYGNATIDCYGKATKYVVWNNVNLKLDNSHTNYFGATLKDEDSSWFTHDKHITWKTSYNDYCLLFDNSITLYHDKGVINLYFYVTIDDSDYLRGIQGF